MGKGRGGGREGSAGLKDEKDEKEADTDEDSGKDAGLAGGKIVVSSCRSGITKVKGDPACPVVITVAVCPFVVLLVG